MVFCGDLDVVWLSYPPPNFLEKLEGYICYQFWRLLRQNSTYRPQNKSRGVCFDAGSNFGVENDARKAPDLKNQNLGGL